jgi:hypothetical protein
MASDGNRIKVHNADWFVETMQSADWTPTGDGVSRAPKIVPKVKDRAKEEKAAQLREAFIEKQSVREKEFQMRFEVAKKEAERRLHERMLHRESLFDERFKTFVERNRTLIQEVDGAIKADVAWRQRKKERLYTEWSNNVFQPMQDQINEQLASIPDRAIEEVRRDMFQRFLEESNRKANGLFRDIIIESDYDPLADSKSAVLRYKKASMADDPTKNRATRELGDRMASGLLKLAPEDERAKLQRGDVPVEMWDRMHATPHGRYNDVTDGPTKPKFNASNVVLDHFNVPRGEAGRAQVLSETKSKGKRVLPAPSSGSGSVHECLSSLPPVHNRPRVAP